MTKFSYKQAQILKERVNTPEIEKQIRNLKEDLRRVRYSKIEMIYNILSKIIQLRKQQNSKYGVKSLVNEDGINLTTSQLRLIFSFPFLSSKTKQLVREGKLSDTIACFMLWRFRFLKEIQWQDRVIKFYLAGKIKASEIGEMNEKDLKHFLLTGNRIKTGDKYALSVLKTISSISSRIKSLAISKENKIKLISRVEGLVGILKKK